MEVAIFQPQIIPQYWPSHRRSILEFANPIKIKQILDFMTYKTITAYAKHNTMRRTLIAFLILILAPIAGIEYLNFTQWLWIAYGDDALIGWLLGNGCAVLAFEIWLWHRK